MPPPTLNSEEPLWHTNAQLAIVGNQSPIPFDILGTGLPQSNQSWESITNPL